MVGLAAYFRAFSEHLGAIKAKRWTYIDHQTSLLYYWKFPISVSRPQVQIPGLHHDIGFRLISF